VKQVEAHPVISIIVPLGPVSMFGMSASATRGDARTSRASMRIAAPVTRPIVSPRGSVSRQRRWRRGEHGPHVHDAERDETGHERPAAPEAVARVCRATLKSRRGPFMCRSAVVARAVIGSGVGSGSEGLSW